MTAAASFVLARAKALGISLDLSRAADDSPCIVWGGPKGRMTAELKADMLANKSDLVGHLRDERKAATMAAFAGAYARIGKTYSDADNAGLPEVERQLPDLFTCVEKLEFEAEVAAGAYREGRGSLQDFVFALETWAEGVLDAVAALTNMRGGKLCNECGSEAPVTLVTTLGQRICSKCARPNAVAARRSGPPRRLSP
jgi:hypothetical protein